WLRRSSAGRRHLLDRHAGSADGIYGNPPTMPQDLSQPNRRVLIVDDTVSIHDDFRRILGAAPESSELSASEAALFGEQAAQPGRPSYEIDSAFQGEEGLAKVNHARGEGRPYALAFVDMRMPPGRS